MGTQSKQRRGQGAHGGVPSSRRVVCWPWSSRPLMLPDHKSDLAAVGVEVRTESARPIAVRRAMAKTRSPLLFSTATGLSPRRGSEGMQRLPHSGEGTRRPSRCKGTLPAPRCVAGELQELAASNPVLLTAGLRDDVRRSVGETSRWRFLLIVVPASRSGELKRCKWPKGIAVGWCRRDLVPLAQGMGWSGTAGVPRGGCWGISKVIGR